MKHNLKNSIKLGVIIFAIILLIPCSVYAEDQHSTNSNKDSSAADKACANAIFDGDVFTITEEGNHYILRFHVKEGTWRIRLFYDVDMNYVDVFKNTPNINDNGFTGLTKEYIINKDQYDEQQVFAIAELQGYDQGDLKIGYNNKNEPLKVNYDSKSTTCQYGQVSINNNRIEIDGTGAFFKSTIKPISTRTYTTLASASADVQNECNAMQLGYYEKDNSTPNKNIPGNGVDAYNAQMKKSFPFCYGGLSTFNYLASDIEKIRKASIDAYREYYNLTNSNQQQMNEAYRNTTALVTNPQNNYKRIEYTNDRTIINKLQCTKEQLEERTEKFYTEVNETPNNKACQVTCLEQMHVTYDPPVASKAGLCFQYKVTVKSKVTCKVDITPNFEWPTPPSSCSYTPICSGNANETQAGPSEEFDSCIQKCDAGKYSQSCINKCYKKVYGSNESKTKKTSSSTTNKTITKTTNNTTSLQKNSESILNLGNNGKDPYYKISGCKTNTEIQKNVETCAQKFYELKQRDPRGTYVLAANHPSWYTHLWQPDDTVDQTTGSPTGDNWIESIKRSSPYYFRNYATALKTIQSFYGKNNGRNGLGYNRYYIIDNGGIKRQKGTYNCGETCGFNSDGNVDGCINSTADAVTSVVTAFNDISDQLSQCSAKAQCKEGEATFNIDVDESKKSENSQNQTTTWNASNYTSNQEECRNPSGEIQMFIPLNSDLESGEANSECNINPNGINGRCYGKDNYGYWQHYKTTITFPGTWIDLKTGRRYYHYEDYDSEYMREKPNYYCVGYDSEPVNEKWWDWKINETNKEKVSPPKAETIDNIKATIADFGKYNWSVNLNCFYAISNKITTSCIGDECNTTIDNVRLRPVDQSDLFAGRTDGKIGFNWTSQAKDNVAGDKSGYNIDPGEYAEELQNIAKTNPESVYSGTTDYSIHLTKDNIKNIRSYVKKKGYTSYESNIKYKEVEDVEGLYYYTSTILGNNSYTSQFSRNATLGKNND